MLTTVNVQQGFVKKNVRGQLVEGADLSSCFSVSSAKFMQMYALYIYFYKCCTFCE